MDSEYVSISLKLLAVFALVALNGFFVATEFALVAVRRSRMESLDAEGDVRARPVLNALNDLDGYIAATQLGITIASIGLGWIGEPALAALLDPVFEVIMPEGYAFITAHGVAFAIAFAIITTLHVVLGELAPKALALQYPETVSMIVAAPTTIFMLIFRPIIMFMNSMGRGVLRLIGVREPDVHSQIYTVEELEIILQASTEGGELEDTEGRIIRRALVFADQSVEVAMVPRTELVTVPVNATLEEIRQMISAYPYNRFPVEGHNRDEIVGILHVRDILPVLIGSQSTGRFRIEDVMRPAYAVPTSLEIDDLFEELKREGTRAAIVIDEHGATAGMVTIEGIIERLVGEVPDEYGQPTLQADVDEDGSVILSGLTPVVDINARFDLSIEPTETEKTIGGYVFARIGEKPEVGDEVELDGYRIRVERLDGLRIAMVRFIPRGVLVQLPSATRDVAVSE